MAVYLIHYPTYMYFETYLGYNNVLVQSIGTITLAVILLSIVITFMFEEPVRKLARKLYG